MFTHLFSRGRVGSMELKNRLFMAPMVRNYADAEGRSTERYRAHIERVARGGVGAITLEASFVTPSGRGFVNQLGLHDDAVVAPLRQLVAAAHEHDVRIGPQLFHAGRQTQSRIAGSQPLAPSPLPCPLEREMPRALSIEEIKSLVGHFGEAARRAMEAGCDYVELHAAHGYLIAEFLSGLSNERTDAYGGSLENRTRFLREIYQKVRDVVSAAPIIVRISAEEGLPGGLTLTETVAIARMLEDWGVDAVHVTTGAYGSYTAGRMIAPMGMPDGLLTRLAERMRASLAIPVITVGKIRSPEAADDLIASEVADFVALGRPLLADPDWPNKAQSGDTADINRCIACQEGCISRLFEQKDAQCLVNPEAGAELAYSRSSRSKRKEVMVVGGGPAGMMAALMASRAGHKVRLFEASDKLGGQLFDAEAEPNRPGWTELRRNLVHRLRNEGVTVQTGTPVTRDMVARDAADTVIVATGSAPRPPSWPTAADLPVFNERELLETDVRFDGRVAIAGGGCSGAQTAVLLAEAGCSVTVIDQRGEIAADAPLDERALLLKQLARLDVTVLTHCKILEASRDRVVADGPTGRLVIPTDTLVLCHGATPNNALAKAIGDLGKEVVLVGDCVSPRRVLEATQEGARAGWGLPVTPQPAMAPVAA